MQRKFVTGIAAAALALTLMGGAAYAAEATSQPSQTVAQEQPTAPTAQHPRAKKAAALLLIKATAEVTDLKPREVIKELRSGKSLAQIAAAKGKTAEAVIQAARTKLQERLSKAVSGGKITQAKADAALKAFDEAAPKLMQSTELGKHPAKG